MMLAIGLIFFVIGGCYYLKGADRHDEGLGLFLGIIGAFLLIAGLTGGR